PNISNVMSHVMMTKHVGSLWIASFPDQRFNLLAPPYVTDLPHLSPRVTDDVTDDLEKNLGKTVFACHAVVLLTKAGHRVTDKYPGEGCVIFVISFVIPDYQPLTPNDP